MSGFQYETISTYAFYCILQLNAFVRDDACTLWVKNVRLLNFLQDVLSLTQLLGTSPVSLNLFLPGGSSEHVMLFERRFRCWFHH
jgi:hypothetical protein